MIGLGIVRPADGGIEAGHVQQHTAADHAAVRPRIDAEPAAAIGVDAGIGDSVVVAVHRMADVGQAVPLGTPLQPQAIHHVIPVDERPAGVVITAGLAAAGLVTDPQDLVRGLGPPGKLGRFLSRQAQREHLSRPDQPGGPGGALIREQV